MHLFSFVPEAPAPMDVEDGDEEGGAAPPRAAAEAPLLLSGRRLYRQLVAYPQEMIPIFDIVLNEEFREQVGRAGAEGEDETRASVKARVFGLLETRAMRDLDPDDIDTLVAIKGMVIRTSEVIPEMQRGYFRCAACGFVREVEVDKGRLDEPAVCEGCALKHSMALVHNRCSFLDKQMIKVQESPESIPEGETPHTIVLYAVEDLVDGVVPGDRVTVTGVFRAIGMRPDPKRRSLKAIFRTFVDVIHYQKTDKERIASMDPHTTAGEYGHEARVATDPAASFAGEQARADRCRAMAEDAFLYDKLAHSLAPSLWECDDVKKGVLLQLFGGCNKDLGADGRIRGEINVLLCGDPGTAKSQLLSYVHKIAPRGMYTSGTGSSAVGLTAYITKDPESRENVLESGALVLSDRGVCCIVRRARARADAALAEPLLTRPDPSRPDPPLAPAAHPPIAGRVRQDDGQHAQHSARGHGAADRVHRQGRHHLHAKRAHLGAGLGEPGRVALQPAPLGRREHPAAADASLAL